MFLKAVSWSGADVKEPGLLADLITEQGHIIDNEGDIAQITVSGRGGQLASAGQDLPGSLEQPQQRMDGRLGSGSLHHNIHFDYSENRISPLEGERKGYDRMRGASTGRHGWGIG